MYDGANQNQNGRCTRSCWLNNNYDQGMFVYFCSIQYYRWDSTKSRDKLIDNQ